MQYLMTVADATAIEVLDVIVNCARRKIGGSLFDTSDWNAVVSNRYRDNSKNFR